MSRAFFPIPKGGMFGVVEQVKWRNGVGIGNFRNSKAFYGFDVRVHSGLFCLDNFYHPIYYFVDFTPGEEELE